MTNKSRIYLLLFLLYCQYGVDVILSICAQHIVCLDISERMSIAWHSADGNRVVGQSMALAVWSLWRTFMMKTLGPVVMLPTNVWLRSRISTERSRRVMAACLVLGSEWQND